ncbi:ABC transporter ATP-binding protein [Actinospica robiniae]|uniref:ABC transporter ATP-binding protein n=1 Tax=Actinospica robiniae TaxID=304901 RepID=UPI0003FDCD3B|nr:ABC transporter ATP-binding protein [Actinospica robiniae]
MSRAYPEADPGQLRSATPPVVEARELVRTYGSGRTEVRALQGVTFDLAPGSLTAVRGRSGSGKTTLLNLIGGLDRPTAGTVRVDGTDLAGLSETGLRALRRSTVAFVFQTFGLLPFLTAAENVGIPLRMAGLPRREREEREQLLLDVTGLGGQARQRANELSGGQQQRVAIARALASRPRLLIADEPTGQLDRSSARQIMALLKTVVRSEGVSALVATHDHAMLDLADEVLTLRDGRIEEA